MLYTAVKDSEAKGYNVSVSAERMSVPAGEG